MFKKLLPLLLLFAGFQANASIIFNGYTHDTSTDIVTGGGLDWLQWDYTIGQSIDTALAGAATSAYGGGWALASNAQMAGLFNSFGFGAFGTVESSRYEYSDPFNSSEDAVTDNELAFISMFGDTYLASGNSHCVGVECVQAARSLYGDDADGDGRFNYAVVRDDYDGGDYVGDTRAGGAMLESDHFVYTSSATYIGAGVALVRSASVPEPSIIALFGLGLVGIGFARRKRQA
jgi:hypothetical protein